MTSPIFVNPQLIQKIQAKTNRLEAKWNVDDDRIFQVWQMVATIELGLAEKVFYDGDGITCDGWNGYKDFENSCRNPARAFGGFYRTEKHQILSSRMPSPPNRSTRHVSIRGVSSCDP